MCPSVVSWETVGLTTDYIYTCSSVIYIEYIYNTILVIYLEFR